MALMRTPDRIYFGKAKKKKRERERIEEEWIPIPCLPNADQKTNTGMGKLSPRVLSEDSSKWRSSDTFLAGLLPAASLRRWEINLHVFYTEFILTQEEGFVGELKVMRKLKGNNVSS